MASFVLLCDGVEPMLSVFQHFFSIYMYKSKGLGWHSFWLHAASAASRRPDLCRLLFAGKTRKNEGVEVLVLPLVPVDDAMVVPDEVGEVEEGGRPRAEPH